ncbi:OmpA family protein [Pseudomonas aeruginosa]
MKKLITPALMLTILTGCSSIPQDYQNTAKFGGIGALAGAVAGAVINHDNRAQGALLGGVLGGAGGAGYGLYVDKQEAELRSKMLGTGITVKRDGDKINLVLPDSITFETGSYRLTPQVQQALNEVAASLQRYPGSSLIITGHADATGTPQSNLQLSQLRANAVSVYLQSQGVEPSRLTVLAAGDSAPIADNNNAQGRAANRRVEMTVTPGAAGAVQPGYQQQTQTQYQQPQQYRPAQTQQRYQYAPAPVYQAPYTANASKRILSNSLLQGISQAITNGPAAGLRSGMATATRGATQEATREVNSTIRDYQYGSFGQRY